MLNSIILAFLLMGFTSLIAQTYLIREFLVIFSGNELTIGIVLGSWILLVALGSYIGNHLSQKAKLPILGYSMLQLGITLALPLSILFIRIARSMTGATAGEGLGISTIFALSLAVPSALGVLTGLLFPFGCRIFKDYSQNTLESSGTVYVIESIGYIIAGPVVSFIFINTLNAFSAVLLVGFLNLLSAALLLRNVRGSVRHGNLIYHGMRIASYLALVSIIFTAPALHDHSLKRQWKGYNLVNSQNSIYGNLAVTKSASQYTFYSNGIPIITSPVPDIASIEELAHFSMLSHENPKKVLLLGGGAGGLINEILKYPVENLTYVELDPRLIKLIKANPTELTEKELGDPRLNIRYIDGRRFLKSEKMKFDLIIMNLPIPYTLALNRYYSKEFYNEVKASLADGGIFAFRLPGSLTYIGHEIGNINGITIATLMERFNINVIPGYSNVYIASVKKIELDPAVIFNRLQERNIPTKSFNKQYIDERLKPEWRGWFNSVMTDYTTGYRNSDLLPITTYYSIALWNRLFSPKLKWLTSLVGTISFGRIFIFLLVTGLLVSSLTRKLPSRNKFAAGFAIFTTGFFGMALSLIFIYACQSFYGYVFSRIALLFAAFMIGLVAGGIIFTYLLSLLENPFKAFLRIELLAVLFSIFSAYVLFFLNRYPQFQFSVLFLFLLAMAGFFIGAEFPLANKVYLEDKRSREAGGLLYALDLVGSWLAAVLISVIILPLIGIFKTCILLSVLKVVSYMVLEASSKYREF